MAEKIEVCLLGTGSSVPTIRRNHSAFHLRYKDENLLFDCGEGTQRQFRKAEINPCKLTKIFITHWHGDHVLGLPGLIQTLQMNNYSGQLEIYGPRGTKKYIERIMDIFVYVGKINIKIYEISHGKAFENEDFYVEAFNMEHNTPTLAYRFVEKDKLRIDKNKLKKLKIPKEFSREISKLKSGKDITIDGKKIKSKDLTYLQEGKKFAIVLDTKYNSKISHVAKDTDLFISESTYLDEEKELAENYLHMTSKQAAEAAKKAKAKKLILVHMSQKHELNGNKMLNEAKKIFKNTILGEDLMKFEI